MATFRLKIVTTRGLQFDGEVNQVTVRTTEGPEGILAHHMDMVAPLGAGLALVDLGDSLPVRRAACIGGMVIVHDNEVTLLPAVFDLAEDIDLERTEISMMMAQEVLSKKVQETDAGELMLAEARLKRALVRKAVVESAPLR